uniref:Uncharacterized protein n=1 Tax=Solanum lycopersicum TaxID=4081 RepID=A0A3Q7G8D7_SOLLC
MRLMKAIRNAEEVEKGRRNMKAIRPSYYCKNVYQGKRKGRRSYMVLYKAIKIHQEIRCETLVVEDEVDASSNGKKQAT